LSFFTYDALYAGRYRPPVIPASVTAPPPPR
jgi:hypothetical protein